MGHRDVDEEVEGEVDHDQQVRHTLQAHHVQGWDILEVLLYTPDLYIWNSELKIKFKQCNGDLYLYIKILSSSLKELVSSRLLSSFFIK